MKKKQYPVDGDSPLEIGRMGLIQTGKRARKRHHVKEALVTCSLHGLIHLLPESLQPARRADETGKP